MEVMMSKVWLVTGSASGLGRDIAEAVLASGDRLLATARNPRRLDDLVERYGEEQLPTHLLLGSDAVQYARSAEDRRESDAEVWRDISVSTDAEGTQDHATLKL